MEDELRAKTQEMLATNGAKRARRISNYGLRAAESMFQADGDQPLPIDYRNSARPIRAGIIRRLECR